MGQGGMMNVPGVQKPAHFTLEGEGDHVLSKRKLDELVRQITGSVSPEDGLAPEVEECVLSMTDNFVDTVIQKACALAKLRQGQTLEVKDVQMVLERNYGIRIPGYSLDELSAEVSARAWLGGQGAGCAGRQGYGREQGRLIWRKDGAERSLVEMREYRRCLSAFTHIGRIFTHTKCFWDFQRRRWRGREITYTPARLAPAIESP
jgi:transcription initiation factor TFIID subunit 12